MKTKLFSLGLLATASLTATPALSEDDNALVTFQALKPEIAMELAKATMDACREDGYQVSAAVVDRFGQTQAVLRDRFAGVHTVNTATGKAWTAVSFRGDTLDIQNRIASGELSAGLRDIPGAVALGGGVPVESAGSIVAGLGVSGAPTPQIDDECARKGIETIEDQLAF